MISALLVALFWLVINVQRNFSYRATPALLRPAKPPFPTAALATWTQMAFFSPVKSAVEILSLTADSVSDALRPLTVAWLAKMEIQIPQQLVCPVLRTDIWTLCWTCVSPVQFFQIATTVTLDSQICVTPATLDTFWTPLRFAQFAAQIPPCARRPTVKPMCPPLAPNACLITNCFLITLVESVDLLLRIVSLVESMETALSVLVECTYRQIPVFLAVR